VLRFTFETARRFGTDDAEELALTTGKDLTGAFHHLPPTIRPTSLSVIDRP